MVSGGLLLVAVCSCWFLPVRVGLCWFVLVLVASCWYVLGLIGYCWYVGVCWSSLSALVQVGSSGPLFSLGCSCWPLLVVVCSGWWLFFRLIIVGRC